MKVEYYKEYSEVLKRDMEFKVYGHAGIPFIAFPAQDGRFFDLENFGIIDCIANFIEEGKVQIFTVDTIDGECYSATGDNGHRSYMLEQYYYYIVDEVVPRVHDINNSNQLIMTTGVSLGATHAANMFFRRPDLFGGVISMSGYFDSDLFFYDYHDEFVYNNSPLQYLNNMPDNHPYIKLYNQRHIMICCGKGAYEDLMCKSSGQLADVFYRKGINGWIDFWGEDVNHDWNWWLVQLPYFINNLLEGGY